VDLRAAMNISRVMADGIATQRALKPVGRRAPHDGGGHYNPSQNARQNFHLTTPLR